MVNCSAIVYKMDMTKRFTFYVVFSVLLAFSAQSATHAVFYGTWGTQAQCAREPIKPGGTVLSSPFEIDKQWLKQGQQWCILNWGVVEKRENGYFTVANALCGEDAPQSYFLGLILEGEDLTLRWDFPRSNGPLQRCIAK